MSVRTSPTLAFKQHINAHGHPGDAQDNTTDKGTGPMRCPRPGRGACQCGWMPPVHDKLRQGTTSLYPAWPTYREHHPQPAGISAMCGHKTTMGHTSVTRTRLRGVKFQRPKLGVISDLLGPGPLPLTHTELSSRDPENPVQASRSRHHAPAEA